MVISPFHSLILPLISPPQESSSNLKVVSFSAICQHIVRTLLVFYCYSLNGKGLCTALSLVTIHIEHFLVFIQYTGVSCDSCSKGNFRGKRFKCLICYDYDLCSTCYENGATTTRHTADHPMQCILTRTDFGKC